MENCSICKAVEDHTVLQEGKECVLVQFGREVVAATKHHIDNCSVDALEEAIDLLKSKVGNGIICQDMRDVGHWSIMMIASKLGAGKAQAKDQ